MEENWKSQTYLRGAIIGLVVGLIAANLYARAAEEANDAKIPALRANDVVKLGLSILGIVRQITELGGSNK
ncbi:MAG: hypothetical protein H6673_13825 [Anaerolineales bacterium]|nr:hypothetical protein [Anaerolineales bacterium]